MALRFVNTGKAAHSPNHQNGGRLRFREIRMSGFLVVSWCLSGFSVSRRFLSERNKDCLNRPPTPHAILRSPTWLTIFVELD